MASVHAWLSSSASADAFPKPSVTRPTNTTTREADFRPPIRGVFMTISPFVWKRPPCYTPSLYHGAEHLLLPACRSQRTLLTCAYKAILHTQPKGVRKHS